MRKAYCKELVKRLVHYTMSMWMYEHHRASRKRVKEDIEEILEEFENKGKEDA